MVQQTETQRTENEAKISRACLELQKVLREALTNGRRGVFGVKIPIQRGLLGNIRHIVEREV